MSVADSKRPRILLYGLDIEFLQQYASCLLDRDLCHIDVATTEYRFDRYLGRARSPYDLIILCSTIPTDEQTRIRDTEFRYSGSPVYTIRPDTKTNELQDDLGVWLNLLGLLGSDVHRTADGRDLFEKWFGRHRRFALTGLPKPSERT